jgi:hypothetical protein
VHLLDSTHALLDMVGHALAAAMALLGRLGASAGGPAKQAVVLAIL